MKCSFIILFIQITFAGVLIAGTAKSQNINEVKVGLTLKQTSIKESLLQLQAKSGIKFTLFNQLFDGEDKKVTLETAQMSVKDALNKILSGTNLRYKLVNEFIVIEAKPVPVKPGRISGKIVDEKGQGLPGAIVTITELNKTVVSNIDGTYTVVADAGTYTLEVKFVGYQSQQVTEVVVAADKTTVLDVAMKVSATALNTVTVTSSYKKASVEGLYARQKNAPGITDGISAEQIARTPDKNIGESLKRISGLSVVDNKYVVVRGLSERYNQAVLNGQVMPSTELNRKQFTFDIIPANMVENVVVSKTITPDKSAEFGGGLVEVNTKDIPTEDFLSFSVGSSLNDKTQGKPFLSLALDGREYLGSVAKHRNLMGSLDWDDFGELIDYYNKHGKDPGAFSNNWGIGSMKPQPSMNYQVSGGKVLKVAGGDLGLTVSGSYRNTQNRLDINYGKEGWYSATNSLMGADGQRYDFITNLAGMVGAGYRKSNSRVTFQSLYLRTLNQQLSILWRGSSEGGKGWGMYDNTTQTTLWQNQLKGEHLLSKKGMKFNWLANYTYLDRQRPDNHVMWGDVQASANAPDSNNVIITNPSVATGTTRFWDRALEKNLSWDASLSVPFQLANNKQLFKTGFAGWYKDRMFYVLNSFTTTDNHNGFGAPLSTYYGPEYNGYVGLGNFNDYMHKNSSLNAFYGMFDNRFAKKWRLVWGLRGEYLDMSKMNDFLIHQQSSENDLSYFFSREKNLNLFPSANLTYNLTGSMNLRLAYAKSIIRPDLRELAFFSEYDYELGGTYTGYYLRSTLIDNYDFRYEWYPSLGDVVSLSGFYKYLQYPMEVYAYPNNFFQLQNSKAAKNYGMEAEVRKSLAFTNIPVLRNFTLYGNFTYMDAQVQPMDLIAEDVPGGKSGLKMPVEVLYGWEHRPQAGASNYIMNVGINYDTKLFSASVAYNAITNRLSRLSARNAAISAAYQSFYEQPVKSLDAQLMVRPLKQKLEVKLNLSNLLNSYSVIYKNLEPADENGNLKKKDAGYNPGDVVNYRSAAGRTIGLSISYIFK